MALWSVGKSVTAASANFWFTEEGHLRPASVIRSVLCAEGALRAVHLSTHVHRTFNGYQSFHQSRSVLELFLLLVEGFGLDDDGEAVGRTDRPSNVSISDAWHDEHALKIRHWSSWWAVHSHFHFKKHHACKLDNSAISGAELELVTRRVW